VGREQVELHLPARTHAAMVVLLRRNTADRVRRMHAAEHLLAGPMGVLDLVVYGPVVLIAEGALAAAIGMALAAAAGFSQLFSP